MITSLAANEIFVFGSNLAGHHAGGAARQAAECFGATDGVGEGMTGHCYAFPTLGHQLERLPLQQLEASRDRLYSCCHNHPQLRFLLTKVGCGIAGYAEQAMQDLFQDPPRNLVLPHDWQQAQAA
ncbi:A1S_2505 family phage non-structural protein [Tahibacter harae]|uniref:Uncharacterized protein n=1 Tax=Tahibacter harae TaxID=2963937 RepID=A0ABT1QS33_9GAMM|nr:hypothetical protein [Tahibacter harae]MCQ4165105.1 hypothetical protein [Tahibacter harae]